MSGTGAVSMVEPQWEDWIGSNLRAGCDPADMQRSMVKAGWDARRAAAVLSDRIARLTPAPAAAGTPLPLLPPAGRLTCDGQPVKVVLSLATPALALCEDVLSHAECADLIAFAGSRGVTPSTVVDDASGTARPHPERTSSSLMLRRGETPLIARVEQRLAALTRWPVDHGEGVQILTYQRGQEYRAHFDSFPQGPAGAVHMRRGGQRVNTVLVYLHSPEQGGGTHFPAAGLTLHPRPGSAILFRNVGPSGIRAADSLHAGLPVEEGKKIILTYWQRAAPWG